MDLISRQDAIDALKVCITIGRGNGKSVALKIANDYADFVKKRIEELPSAEPEIIHCKDCKHASPNGKYGCKAYHFKQYEVHEMYADDFCSKGERRTDE